MTALDGGALVVAILANAIVIVVLIMLVLAVLRRRTHEGRVSVSLSWRGKDPEPPEAPDSVTDQ